MTSQKFKLLIVDITREWHFESKKNVHRLQCGLRKKFQFVWVPPNSILRMVQVPYKKNCLGVYPFDGISDPELAFKKFSSKLFFSYFFFHFCWFDGVCFQYSQVLVVFLFSKCSDSFLIWQSYSFHCFSFPTYVNFFYLFAAVVSDYKSQCMITVSPPVIYHLLSKRK